MNYCFNLEVGVPNVQSSQVVKPVNDSPRRFECDICQKTFRRREHQLRHISTQHKGEKPHVCTVVDCKKRYTRREELLKHVRLHHEANKGHRKRPSEHDQQSQRKRVLLPRLSMTAIVAAQNPAKDANGSFVRSLTGPAELSEGQRVLPLVFNADVDINEVTQDHSNLHARDHDAVANPSIVTSSASTSASRPAPQISTGEGLRPPGETSEITSPARIPELPPMQEMAHTSTSPRETLFDPNVAFVTHKKSISTNEMLKLSSPTPFSARSQDMVTKPTVPQTNVPCTRALPPSRQLPISFLCHSRERSIENIFNGSSRDLPLPQPP